MGAARGLESVSAIAEEIVHESFAAVHREWRRLRDAERAVAHLRRCTVQGTRRLRDRTRVPGPMVPGGPAVAVLPGGAVPDGAVPDGAVPDGAVPDGAVPDGALPSAGPEGGAPVLGARVLSALRGLPCWQREALVLRYYADLPEGQAAAAMGVTRAAFRGHATRGMAALHRILEQGRHRAQELSTA